MTGDLVSMAASITAYFVERDETEKLRAMTERLDRIEALLQEMARPRPPGRRLAVSFPAALRPFFIVKGSVAVDGVSLTVASLGPSSFEVELIPLTLEGTNLGLLRAGDKVNLECDMVGKYVVRAMEAYGRPRTEEQTR